MQILDDQFIDEQLREPLKVASLWDRFAAYFIDGLVLTPLSWLNAYQANSIGSSLLSLLITLVSFSYKPLLEADGGRTVGKRVMGLKVVRQNGGDIGLKESVIRYFPWIALVGGFYLAAQWTGIDLLNGRTISTDDLLDEETMEQYARFSSRGLWFVLLFLISLGYAFMNRKRQGLHDLAANTLVVKTRAKLD